MESAKLPGVDTAKQLGEEKVLQLLFKFSIPAIVGMLVNALYNVVDRIFIGNGVGSLGIAGVTIGFPIMVIIMAFGMLIGLGANALISIRLGEQKKEEAEAIMGNAFILLTGTAVAISMVGLLFLEPLLRTFGASDAVLPYAKDYMSIILFGAVFQSVGFGMNNFIRAEGKPQIAMLTMLIGAFLNTALDPLFIFVFRWGIKGAALATIISQAAVAAWVLSYFLGGRSMLRLSMKKLKLQPETASKIIALGSAPFAMQLASSLLHAIMNRSLYIYGGDIAVSGMGVVMSVMTLIIMPVIGINQGVQPIIGYNYGAQKYDRVKEALKLGIIAATVVVCIGFAFSRLFPEQLISLFNREDDELIAFGSYAISVFMIFLPIVGFQISASGYFQAVGKPKQAMFLSLSRQVLILIPALLILPRFFQLKGVLMAGPLADLISSIITGIWLCMELYYLNQKSRNVCALSES